MDGPLLHRRISSLIIKGAEPEARCYKSLINLAEILCLGIVYNLTMKEIRDGRAPSMNRTADMPLVSDEAHTDLEFSRTLLHLLVWAYGSSALAAVALVLLNSGAVAAILTFWLGGALATLVLGCSLGGPSGCVRTAQLLPGR